MLNGRPREMQSAHPVDEHRHELAATDPALYRTLREGITRFFLRGGGSLNLAKLEALATA